MVPIFNNTGASMLREEKAPNQVFLVLNSTFAILVKGHISLREFEAI